MEHSNQSSAKFEDVCLDSGDVNKTKRSSVSYESQIADEAEKSRKTKTSKANSLINKVKRAAKFETGGKGRMPWEDVADNEYSEKFTDENFCDYEMEQYLESCERDVEVAEIIREVAEYEARTVDEEMRCDYCKIKDVYPDIDEKSIGYFGNEFLELLKSISDPVVAYEAVRAKKLRETKNPPPNIGAVNNVSGEDKDFYTPDEVDKLTREDFKKNPRLLDVVRKSMLKWK